MGALPMDEETQGRVRDLALRAAKPENWYRPGEAAVPGDNAFYREIIGTYKVVFTWTVGPDKRVWRHMSMSSVFEGKLPVPQAAFTVALWLGFTGAVADEHGIVNTPSPDWRVGMHETDECWIIGEPIQ